MNILAISDIHGNFNEGLFNYLNNHDLDLVIVSGDITNFGPLEFVGEFLNKICSYGTTTVAIPGNCDPNGVINEINESQAICAHGTIVHYENLIIYGFGGSNPTPFNTPFEFNEETIYNSIKGVMDSKQDKINGNEISKTKNEIEILLTHAPPYNTEVDKIPPSTHVGSKSIRTIIEDYKPRLNLCGHVHEAKAFDIIENTIIANPGMLENGFGSLIEIDDNNNIITNLVELK